MIYKHHHHQQHHQMCMCTKRDKDEKLNFQETEWFCIRCHQNRRIWHSLEFDLKAIQVNSRDAFIASLLWHYTTHCAVLSPISHINVSTCLLYANRSRMEIQLEILLRTKSICLYFMNWMDWKLCGVYEGMGYKDQVKWNTFFTRNQQSLTVECNYSITHMHTHTHTHTIRNFPTAPHILYRHTLWPPPPSFSTVSMIISSKPKS